MADNQKGYRKLIDLRNQFLLNQINLNEFLNKIESTLYNNIGVDNINLAGGRGQYSYLTITRRLMADELGESESLNNLKIDITY